MFIFIVILIILAVILLGVGRSKVRNKTIQVIPVEDFMQMHNNDKAAILNKDIAIFDDKKGTGDKKENTDVFEK